MRFSTARPQVITVSRPISRQSRVLAGFGDDMVPFEQSSSQYTMLPPTAMLPEGATAPTAPTMAPSWVEQQPAAPSAPTDWTGIFNTSAKLLSAAAPAVTGILSINAQKKAQQAASDLAMAQARLAAGYPAPASSGLPSWVVPVALGGVALLAAGFFLTHMPRSAPSPATNPRKRR
jgi:hypothetical protein